MVRIGEVRYCRGRQGSSRQAFMPCFPILEAMVSHTIQESAFILPFQEGLSGRSRACPGVEWESSKPTMEKGFGVEDALLEI